MNRRILILVGAFALSAYAIPEPSHELSQFVDSFDISGFPCGQGKRVQANRSVDGHALTTDHAPTPAWLGENTGAFYGQRSSS